MTATLWPGTSLHAKRRLRFALAMFFVALALPVMFLVRRVYQQIELQELYELRGEAATIVSRIDQRVAQLLEPEEKRSIDEYSFLRVGGGALLKSQPIGISPLSELPPKSEVPGIIGYFQIAPDGTLSSPVLPALPRAQLQNPDVFGFSADELTRRLALRDRLQRLLSASDSRGNEFADRERGGAGIAATRSAGGRSSDSSDVRQEPKKADHPSSSVGKMARVGQELVPPPASAPSQQYAIGGYGTAIDELRRDSADITQEPEAPQEAESNRKRNEIAEETLLDDSSSALQGKLAYRGKRKEVVNLPSQTTVAEVQQALTNLNATAAGELEGEADSDFKKEIGTFNAGIGDKLSTPKVSTFESEVAPFRSRLLASNYVVFYRQVTRDTQRFVQGFIVDGKQFLNETVPSGLANSELAAQARVTVRANGSEIAGYGPASSSYKTLSRRGEAKELLSQKLYIPLEFLEVTVAASPTGRNPSAQTVDLLAATIGIVMVVGLAGIYRLGIGQIEFAAQRSDFVSAVSHELKTPLTSIRMYSEMLRNEWVGDESKKRSYYDFIFFESERLSRLIANVLQLSRISNNSAPFELKTLEPAAVIDLARSKVATQAAASGFELVVSTPLSDQRDEQIKVSVDEDAITQIFINLVDNAIKFSGKEGERRIEIGYRVTTAGQRQVVFFVRDFGPGVPKDQMKKIFKLFYRVENELTRQTTGTGIGLALVQELAAKMNATVDLQNREPGAEFQVRFGI